MNDWQSQLSLVKQGILARSKRERDRMLVHRDRELHISQQRQVVVNGEISRDPVNKQAAMLLSSGDWLCLPPDAQERKPRIAEQEKPKRKHRRRKKMSKQGIGETTLDRNDRNFPKDDGQTGVPRDHNPQEYYNIPELAVRVIEIINKHPQQLTPLARAALDARTVLDESVHDIGTGMENFDAKVKVFLEDLRQTRFAFVSETSQILKPLAEIRQFFLGKDYELEISRLKEFVSLCERLAHLKKDGTLDAISDTIIKLAI